MKNLTPDTNGRVEEFDLGYIVVVVRNFRRAWSVVRHARGFTGQIIEFANQWDILQACYKNSMARHGM